MLVRPRPARREPALRRPAPASPSTWPSATRTTAATSRRRYGAASGVAKCRTTTAVGLRPSCARPSGRPARRSTPRAGAPGCCTRCSRARWSPTAGGPTEVRDALDLCLSCKGCRTRLPGGRRHGHVQGGVPAPPLRGPPPPGRALRMGWLPRWLRLAARTRTAPLVNALARVGPLAALAKRLGGIAPGAAASRALARGDVHAAGGAQAGAGGAPERPGRQRRRPSSCGRTPSPNTSRRRSGQAAVRVLEAARAVPTGRACRRRRAVCCGLTYVSTGQLDRGPRR